MGSSILCLLLSIILMKSSSSSYCYSSWMTRYLFYCCLGLTGYYLLCCLFLSYVCLLGCCGLCYCLGLVGYWRYLSGFLFYWDAFLFCWLGRLLFLVEQTSSCCSIKDRGNFNLQAWHYTSRWTQTFGWVSNSNKVCPYPQYGQGILYYCSDPLELDFLVRLSLALLIREFRVYVELCKLFPLHLASWIKKFWVRMKLLHLGQSVWGI